MAKGDKLRRGHDFPITFDHPRQAAEVWYCRTCRRAAKVHPPGATATGCKCVVPVIPIDSTLVSWPASAVPSSGGRG